MPAITIISMKRYLYALAGVVALALVGMLGFTLYSDYYGAVAQEKQRIAMLTQLIADNASQTLEHNHDRLVRLGKRPAIRAMDAANCDPILAEFRDLFPEFANLTTIDVTGSVPCSGVPSPDGKPISVAKAKWFQRAQAEKQFIVGNPFMGPFTGKMVSVLVEPVRGDERQLLGFLGLPLDLERFNPRIPVDSLPAGTRFGFVAGDGTLVWRNIDPENLIGQNIGDQQGLHESLRVRDGGFENRGTDGVARYFAVASVPLANWVAFMSVPAESITEKIFAAAARNAMIGLIALIVIGILLSFLMRRIEQAEQDLLHARDAAEAANRAKSMFLANMSHELRTPLNAILGFAELMARDSLVPASQRRNLNIINRSGHHLLSLINDILEISRIEAGRLAVQPVDCDLHELIAVVFEAMELRARNDGLELELHQSAEVPHFICTDVGKLRQVLINLLSNAIKYTPHGKIEMAVGSSIEDGRTLLRISVSDTGAGIAADDLERIFQPFFQTEYGIRVGEGTGLGLAIARQYAQLLGGELTASSAVGVGSKFTLCLPVNVIGSLTAVPARRRVLGLAPGQAVRRILVVEDKEDNQRLLTQLMEAAGFEVEVAANGADAVEVFQQRRPDFIWMDMRMPVMDGYEATRRIRALPGGAALPIVALTASAFEEDRAAILDAGCTDMVRKPLEADHLFEILSRRLAVDFVYADDAANAPNTAPESAGQSWTLDLSPLTPALRQRLYDAATALDIGVVRAIADEVTLTHPALAEALLAEAEQYRFDALLAAIAATDAKKAAG